MLKRIAILTATYYLHVTGAASAECRDLNGRRIAQGIHYVPGPDACTLCVCDNGNPKWCKAVLCSPPQDCKSFRVGNTCCEFICLDDTLSKTEGGLHIDSHTDLGLRLAASAFTALLSLSLIIFAIYRVRKRKILGRRTRQLSEDERSLGSIGYIAGSIGYLQGSMGYLGNGSNDMEFHYEEPPSHYPLGKPSGNYFPRGEAPPPYEEAVAAARAEAALIANSAATTTTIQYPITINSSNVQRPQQSQPQQQSVTSHSTIPNHIRTDIIVSQPSTISTIHRNDMATNTTFSREVNRSYNRSDGNVNDHNIRGEAHKNTSGGNEPRAESSHGRADRGERHTQTTGISVILHNGHRTIPKNMSNSSNLRTEHVVSITSILKQDYRQDKPTETKSLPKRTSILKDKSNDATNSSRQHDSSSPSCSREICTSDTLGNRHRTIPRYLTSNGLHHSNTTPHSSYNIANVTSSVCGGGQLPRPNSAHFSSSAISLPTSPVPPPIVFSNNSCLACENAKEASNTLHKMANSTSTLLQSSKPSTVGPTNQETQSLIKKDSSIILYPSSAMDVDSSLDGSYQCLHQTFDDGDDYRSECENCKSAHGSRYYLAENEEDELSSPNETMTLQRRPLDPQVDTLGHGPAYYRTSLTLPTNTKKLRSTSMHGTPSNQGAREAWFSSMPESTSSEED